MMIEQQLAEIKTIVLLAFSQKKWIMRVEK